MDTLCIPVDPSLKHVRKQAIRQMKEIYHSSYQVLVLDAEIPIANASDVTEAFMRISLSGWMLRLWTLQEGVLGDRLHFRFKDSAFDVQKEHNKLMQTTDRSTGAIIARGIENTKGTPRSDCQQFFWRMRTLRSTIFGAEEKKMVGYRTSITYPDKSAQRLTEDRKRCAGVMAAFEAARYRTTS